MSTGLFVEDASVGVGCSAILVYEGISLLQGQQLVPADVEFVPGLE